MYNTHTHVHVYECACKQQFQPHSTTEPLTSCVTLLLICQLVLQTRHLVGKLKPPLSPLLLPPQLLLFVLPVSHENNSLHGRIKGAASTVFQRTVEFKVQLAKYNTAVEITQATSNTTLPKWSASTTNVVLAW